MEKVELAHLADFAQKVLEILLQPLDIARGKSRATLVALQGDLGSGKTTFVQALAKALGVQDAIQSPTYVLMKSYELPPSSNQDFKFTKLVHIDAYRLEKPEQFAALKPEAFLSDPKNIVCIEWPERLEGMLPKPDLTIRFSSEGMQEGERGVEIEK